LDINEFLNNLRGRVLIVGIGNPQRGDDYVGSYIAKYLEGKLSIPVIDCEDRPERFLDKITKERADTVIIIDSIQMNEAAGSFAFFSEDNFYQEGLFTHETNLALIIKYLKEAVSSQIIIIGIQPEKTQYGESMSKKVKETADLFLEILIKKLSSIK